MKQTNQVKPELLNDRGNMYVVNWIIIAVLSGCCMYLYITRNRMASDNNLAMQQKQQIIDSVKTDRAYLQVDFDAASARIDQIMSKNAGLNDSLQARKAALAELQTQIRTILRNQKASQSELVKARDMIYMLNDRTKTYELYIADLEKENKTLTGENEQLSKERDETVETNIALKMTGAVLHASNIRMEPIHERSHGREKETSKAKNVDKLRIIFDIDENRIANSGTKEVYVRIIAPGNNVLYSEGLSGTIGTMKEGEIKFSALKEVDLTKNLPAKNVVLEWQQTDSYTKGVYDIELYNRGYKIGQASLELK